MAFGSCLAGLLYNHFGFYAPAFGFGVTFNVINLMLVGNLILRQAKGDAASRSPSQGLGSAHG